jgi:hypothetical protein
MCLLGFIGTHVAQAQPNVGDNTIATWQDNHTAAFMLLFDDSWPSHFQVAIPALIERNMIGTFYINPGKGEYKAHKDKWENELWKTGMVYGNHTMTHKGVKDFQDAQHEIGDCTQRILDIVPGNKPRLISWAKPGVGKGKWNITGDELEQILKPNNLITRPPFKDHGAVYHLKKLEQYTLLVDKAIEQQNAGYVIIHGLERRAPMITKWQDFWPMNQDLYYQLLDYMASKRDAGQLWITDHISIHQYETQRQTAKVQTVKQNDKSITLKLTCAADPQFYDLPMTLNTRVPSTWQNVKVTQGDTTSNVSVRDGIVTYHARPDGSAIHIQPE